MIKLDKNLCNESWFEMEIANMQTDMANYPYLSEEYMTLASKMDDYAMSVVRIEGVKREREIVIAKYIECGTKIACTAALGIFALAITRRLIR